VGPGAPPPAAALALVALCLLDALVLGAWIVRARVGGARLSAAVFLVFFGVASVLTQIESAYFVTSLPAGALWYIVALGALVAAPCAVVGPALLRRGRPAGAAATLPVFTRRGWGWRSLATAAVYLLLYFGFGYWIAWQSPAVRDFYGGVDEGGFLAHMAEVLRQDPGLIPFQLFRAGVWLAIGLIVISTLQRRRLETALVLGLLFAVLMNAQLLLPNPYMPDPVRFVHAVETASSNFLFGAFVGWLFGPP